MKARYLIFMFYDNDFGFPICKALRKVWKFIHNNNAHCLREKGKGNENFSDRDMYDIFRKLYNNGTLSKMLELLYASYEMQSRVEYATRGLYWTKVDWGRNCWKESAKPPAIPDSYISFDKEHFVFKRNDEFKKKWQNGEYCYLDLETGKCKTW